MNLETTRLRGRPRNRWQDEVREDGRIVGGEEWQIRVNNRGVEEAPENIEESSHSAHANGMNEWINDFRGIIRRQHAFVGKKCKYLASNY
jgi:hypothetical protein